MPQNHVMVATDKTCSLCDLRNPNHLFQTVLGFGGFVPSSLNNARVTQGLGFGMQNNDTNDCNNECNHDYDTSLDANWFDENLTKDYDDLSNDKAPTTTAPKYPLLQSQILPLHSMLPRNLIFSLWGIITACIPGVLTIVIWRCLANTRNLKRPPGVCYIETEIVRRFEYFGISIPHATR